MSDILLLFRHCHHHLDEERGTQKFEAENYNRLSLQIAQSPKVATQKLLFVFVGPILALVHLMSTHDIAKILEKKQQIKVYLGKNPVIFA